MQMKSRSAVTAPAMVLVRVALMVTALAAFVRPVAAKGPVSGKLAGPGLEQPVELVDWEERDLVVKLMEQTGLWYGTGDLPRPLAGPPGELGPGYTLTWINGGPPDKSEAARTIYQMIYPHAQNGPAIHTPAQDTLEHWGPDVVGWFAAPEGLTATLAALGASLPAGEPDRPVAASGVAVAERALAGVVALSLLAALVGTLGVRRLRLRQG